MYTENDQVKLNSLLDQKQHDTFFTELDQFTDESSLEPIVAQIKEEWRKLQIARRNGLMDQDQIDLAFAAFFRKKSAQMLETSSGETI